IYQDLFELDGINTYIPQFRMKRCKELNLLTNQAAKHLSGFNDDGVQIQDSRMEHLFAAESQELARQRSGAIDGFFDLGQVLEGRMSGLHLFCQELSVAADDAKQVVEIVSQASGETANGFQLL